MKNKPIAQLFIDDANMFFAQKNMGWFIDWRKISVYFSKQYSISQANYYTGLGADIAKRQSYFQRLEKSGYSVITKPLKKIFINKDKYILKANVDVEIATDLIYFRSNFDIAILFSGDSDFEYVVKRLQKEGKSIIVCAQNRGLSRELRNCADKVILLGTIRKKIELKKDLPPK